MNKYERLQTFVVTVQESGFSAAARKLGLSKAAVSLQVSELEKTLKTVLLERSTRKIKLTEAGKRYYQHCLSIIRAMEQAESELSAFNEEPQGKLHVVVGHYFCKYLIIPHLKGFLQQHPKVTVQLDTVERVPDFEREGIDLLFGLSCETPEHWVRRRLMETGYVLCASPAYLAEKGIPQQPQDLLQHHHIIHTSRNQQGNDVLLDDLTAPVEPYLRVDSTLSLLEAAVAGLGIAKIQRHELPNERFTHGYLVEVLPEYRAGKETVYCYYHPARRQLPKIRAFVDYFNQQLQSHLDGRATDSV